jgi:hypothetical protein
MRLKKLVWMFPLALTLHNLEEAIWLPAWSQPVASDGSLSGINAPIRYEVIQCRQKYGRDSKFSRTACVPSSDSRSVLGWSDYLVKNNPMGRACFLALPGRNIPTCPPHLSEKWIRG